MEFGGRSEPCRVYKPERDEPPPLKEDGKPWQEDDERRRGGFQFATRSSETRNSASTKLEHEKVPTVRTISGYFVKVKSVSMYSGRRFVSHGENFSNVALTSERDRERDTCTSIFAGPGRENRNKPRRG